MHMYLATGGVKVQQQELDAGEDIEILLVSMDHFIQLVRNDAFLQAMHMNTIYRALEKLGRIQFI